MSFQLPTYHAPDFNAAFLKNAPDVVMAAAPRDGVVPENYHGTTVFTEYFKVNGTWLLAEESRMDCVAVYKNGRVLIVEARNVLCNDLVILGRTENAEEGIYVYTKGFVDETAEEKQKDIFSFRSGRSRETAFSRDYDNIYELLEHEKEQGKIVWVMGPACSFDYDARKAFSQLINGGYVHALLAGNALATHDLEGAYKKTALGQNIYTQEAQSLGHYNHIDTINKVREYGSIAEFIKGEHIDNGIIFNCVKNKVPFVLAGSIRDDGPLPEVYADVYEAQAAMREQVSQATTVICLATTLHTIATGNMTPAFRVLPDGTVRPVYFYVVDISEFAVNKLSDRGSISATGIVTNVQDFIVNVAKALSLTKRRD